MTRAQEYLLKAAEEQLTLAEKEIPRLYEEFWKAKKSREVFPDVYEGMMHTIGYWEGVKNTCKSVIEFMEMSEYDFRNFETEQEKIRLHNERMKEEILKSIHNKFEINAEEKPKEEE